MKMSVVRSCVVVWAGRWVWLCPFLMLGLAAAILMLLGLSVWTAVLIAILLACPTIMIWGAIQVRRRKPEG